MSSSERREMIHKESTDLSLTRHCKLRKVGRSSIFYTPVGFDQGTIDLIFTKQPFFSSRKITAFLPQSGFSVGRHRVRCVMGIMGLPAIYNGQYTFTKLPEHTIYLYLLRKLPITWLNQAGCSGIPVKNSFMHLVAIMDWATNTLMSGAQPLLFRPNETEKCNETTMLTCTSCAIWLKITSQRPKNL